MQEFHSADLGVEEFASLLPVDDELLLDQKVIDCFYWDGLNHLRIGDEVLLRLRVEGVLGLVNTLVYVNHYDLLPPLLYQF